ncbi:MAG: sensor histidine kinase [Thermoanaerobaculia bacterium]
MRWTYAAAWMVLLAIYAAAFLVNGVPAALAVRNAMATLLPDALLGLALLRLPGFLPWSERRKARFFSAHAAMLIAFTIAAVGGWIALVALDSLLFTGRVSLQINYRIVPFRILYDVLIYGTLAGVAYVRDQAARAANAEALRARASLEAMRSQLNPHFILNTFHALVGLVRRDPAVAERALEQLGDLLRYSLRIQRDGIDEVPLREECAFVESYLALERLRLGDRLSVHIEPLPPDEAFVPTFALQTLVENAIHHAIAPRAAGGLLQIGMRQEDGRLRVSVQDSGGSSVPRSSSDEAGNGLGLNLLQERLAALYGNDATLTLHGVDGGTRAELSLPMRRMQEEA